MPKVYQVRGFDFDNISFVKGDTGWTIFAPLTYEEATGAALELVNRHLGKFPVIAVVYSHSHGDHWGSARGVVDEAEDRGATWKSSRRVSGSAIEGPLYTRIARLSPSAFQGIWMTGTGGYAEHHACAYCGRHVVVHVQPPCD